MLKLNREKFEYILFHSRQQYLNLLNFALLIGDTTFMPNKHVRNLGIHQNKSLTMEKHVSSITKASYYQIRCISKIDRFINTDACHSLMQSTVISRMDYAKVLFHGLPRTLLDSHKLVQNTCARLVSRTHRREHIIPVLVESHWLPVEHRSKDEVLLYTYKAFHGCAPKYICDLVQMYSQTQTIRLSSQCLLKAQHTLKITYGSNPFGV